MLSVEAALAMTAQESVNAIPDRARRLLAGHLRWWPLLLILALACFLRVYRLGGEPLWYDEGASWRFSQMSHEELWFGKGRAETNPPLYYSIQRLWRVFGESEFALRSPAMLFGLLGVGLVYGLGRELGGRKLGLASALLLATCSVHVEYSQEARAYTGLTAAVIGGLWALAWLLQRPDLSNRFVNRRSAPAWIGYTVSVIFALYFHNTGCLLPMLATVGVIIWWLCTPQRRFAFIGNWAIFNSIALIAWMFWLPTLLHQTHDMPGVWWMPLVSDSQLLRDLRYIFGQGWISTYQPWIDLTFLLFALLGAVALLRQRPVRLLVVGGFALGVPAALFLLSLVLMPIFATRVLLIAAPAWLVMIAAGVLSLRRPLLIAVVLAVLTVIQVRAVAVYYEYKNKGDWKSAAIYVRQHALPTDLILFGDDDFDVCFDYYFRAQPGDPTQPDRLAIRSLLGYKPEAYVVLPAVSPDAVADLFQRYPRIWLINWYPRPGIYNVVAQHGQLIESKRFKLQSCVYLFVPQQNAPANPQ